MPVRWPSVDRDATASAEDVKEQFDLLVEANDHLLEQVSVFLNRASGKPQTVSQRKPMLPVGTRKRRSHPHLFCTGRPMYYGLKCDLGT